MSRCGCGGGVCAYARKWERGYEFSLYNKTNNANYTRRGVLGLTFSCVMVGRTARSNR